MFAFKSDWDDRTHLLLLTVDVKQIIKETQAVIWLCVAAVWMWTSALKQEDNMFPVVWFSCLWEFFLWALSRLSGYFALWSGYWAFDINVHQLSATLKSWNSAPDVFTWTVSLFHPHVLGKLYYGSGLTAPSCGAEWYYTTALFELQHSCIGLSHSICLSLLNALFVLGFKLCF